MNIFKKLFSRMGAVAVGIHDHGFGIAGFAKAKPWLLLTSAIVGLHGEFTARAATIPEPDTVFYGRVLNFDHGHELLVTSGQISWVISPVGDDSKVYRLQATLDSLADGTLSYRLKVPHEALVPGLLSSDVSPTSLALPQTDVRYGHSEIRVNGELARILPPASDVFNASAGRRAAAYRLDLEISVPMPDSDGNGLPDWWQEQFFGHRGIDPNADPDHDGWTNLQEYLAGTDPNKANTVPAIALDDSSIDEGTTQSFHLRALDSDTPPERLVYTLIQEPHGASLRLLFGASAKGSNGKIGDRPLHVGDRFTQSQVDSGRLVISHDDPGAKLISLNLSLTDGDTNHGAFVTNLVAEVHNPTPDDGSGAALWLDAREAVANAAGNTLGQWNDRSGAKSWLDGTYSPFSGTASGAPLPIINRGPLGQPVIGFNLNAQNPLQSLSLPDPGLATVFDPGEVTIFAVFHAQGNGVARQQIINGANFQLSVAAAADGGRDSEIRFASEGLGVVYGNRRLKDQWSLIAAWQEQNQLNVEQDGSWVGGPEPLEETIALGTNPALGARNNQGQISEPLDGYLAELLVFNRNLEDAERQRINFALLSKWFGWVILDGSDEEMDTVRRVASSGLSAEQYRTNFVALYGPDKHYILLGGGGKDTLQGGQNDDIFVGGQQADIMTGGGGSDRFVFNFTHIDHGADTITDFDPTGDRDILDITDLLRGTSHDLRDYVHFRTDGHNSYLDIDFNGTSNYTNHTIILANSVLRDQDRYALWAQGNLITGDKRFPLAASISVAKATTTETDTDGATIAVHFSGGPSVPAGLELPFVLSGTAVRGVDYNLSMQVFDPSKGVYAWLTITNQSLRVALKPGDLDFGVRIDPVPNSHSDPTRVVQFALTKVPELYDAPEQSVSIQIVDALQKVRVTTITDQAIPGGVDGAFEVSRSGSLDLPLDISLSMTGPAVNGIDYGYIPTLLHFAPGQASLPVAIHANLGSMVTPAVVAELVLQAGDGYLIDPAASAATITIAATLPRISITAFNALAIQQDGTEGTFVIRRDGPATGALTVLLKIGGSAVAGRDFSRFNAWVNFAPGATLALISVTPVAGPPLNGVKTIDLSLVPDNTFNMGVGSSAEVRLIAAGMTFGLWRANYFPTNAAPSESLALQDSDGDGMPNLIEYGFGFDPTHAETRPAGLPKASIVNGHWALRFTRPIAVLDVDYVIETSPDLVTWTPSNDDFDQVNSTLLDKGVEDVLYVDRADSLTQFASRFARVRVQLK